MPILRAEPDLHPLDLLHRTDLANGHAECWWALYTLPRREKETMRRLRGMDLPFYGPLVARRTRSSAGRVRVSFVPLFAGYVFLYGDGHSRYCAMTTNCVSRWMEVPDGAELTSDLRQIHRLVESGAPLTPEARLQQGMQVRIRSGPFIDTEGVVIRREKRDRLLVAVNFLQTGVSVLIDDYQLERID